MKQDIVTRNAQVERGRKYMERIVDARKRVWEMTERIEQCGAMIARCTAVMGVKVKSSPNPTRMEDGILSLIRLKERLGEALEGYEARVREAEWAIDRLEDPIEREILRYHYLCGEDFAAVTDRMHYADPRYVRKLCADALSHLRVGGCESSLSNTAASGG